MIYFTAGAYLIYLNQQRSGDYKTYKITRTMTNYTQEEKVQAQEEFDSKHREGREIDKELLLECLYADVRQAIEIQKYQELTSLEIKDILEEIINDYVVHKIFVKK